MRTKWWTVSVPVLVLFLAAPILGAQVKSKFELCTDSVVKADKAGKVTKTVSELLGVCDDRKKPSQVSLINTAQAATAPKETKVAAPPPTPALPKVAAKAQAPAKAVLPAPVSKPTLAPIKAVAVVPTPKPTPAPAKVEPDPDPTPAADDASPKKKVATRLPFAKYDLSQEGFARAIEAGKDGDMTTLNVKASNIVKALNAAFPEYRLENRHDAAELIRRLKVGSLPPNDTIQTSRIYSNGEVDLEGWRRPVNPNEQGLFDPQTGKGIFSLHCANIIRNLRVKGWIAPKDVTQVSPAPVVDNSSYLEEKARIDKEKYEKFVRDSITTASRKKLAFNPEATTPAATTTEQPSWRPGKKTAIAAGILTAIVGGYVFSRLASGPGGCAAVGSAGSCK